MNALPPDHSQCHDEIDSRHRPVGQGMIRLLVGCEDVSVSVQIFRDVFLLFDARH